MFSWDSVSSSPSTLPSCLLRPDYFNDILNFGKYLAFEWLLELLQSTLRNPVQELEGMVLPACQHLPHLGSGKLDKIKYGSRIWNRDVTGWSSGKESACRCRGHRFNPWSGKIPHAMRQLCLCATTNEASAPTTRILQWEATTMRSPHTSTRE